MSVRNELVHQLLSPLPSLSLTDSLLLTCFCALAVHRVYNKYDVDPANFLATFMLLGAVPMLAFPFLLRHLDSLVSTILTTYIVFHFVLMLSIILYRVSPSHPLAGYPGPLSLKISKFATMLHACHGKQHIYFKRLHDKYGPCVRVGPNELSIVDVDAIQPVFGVNGTRKGPLYTAHTEPGTPANIVTLRDVDAHRERRKLWNHAFTSTALKDYQPMVAARVTQLAEELGKRVGHGFKKAESVDLAEWMAFFTYDFMSDLVFNDGLELMRDGDSNNIVRTLEQNMKALGIIEHVPWITGLIWRLSLVPENHSKLIELGVGWFKERQEKGSTRKDLFHFITNEDGLEDMDVPQGQAINDIFTAIIAGADTTSTVLGGVFHYLLTHREAYERVRSEIDSVFPHGEGDPFDAVKLAGMPYLNAVINETLRLQPPVPTSLQRSPLEGSGGKWVAGRFIPENTAVYIPPYVLHRDDRYFSPSPNYFIPERWLDSSQAGRNISTGNDGNGQSKFTTNTSAFIPFSSGPANCAGKNLALLEMRMVIATLVQKFDMRLEEGYSPREWEDELEDFFVMKTGRLPVNLIARE